MKEQAKRGGVASHPERYLAFSILLLAMGTTITIVQYKVPSILGPLMESYGMSSSTGSWLMSVFTAVGIFLSIPAGSLAKKMGPKRVLLLGCGVIVLGSVVGAAAGKSLRPNRVAAYRGHRVRARHRCGTSRNREVRLARQPRNRERHLGFVGPAWAPSSGPRRPQLCSKPWG